MNCVNCGHDITLHAGIGGPAATVKNQCYGFNVVEKGTLASGNVCDCKHFVIPCEEPKPKLCICGSLSRCPIILSGACREDHSFSPPCGAFHENTEPTVASPATEREITARELDRLIANARTWERRCGEERAEREKAERRLEYERNARINGAAAAKQKIDELERWKAEAMSVTPDWQAIGKELGLEIGDTVHDKVLPALISRRVEIEDSYRKERKARQALNDELVGDACTRSELRAALTLEQERHAGARALLAQMADRVEKALYVSHANVETFAEQMARIRRVFEKA